MQPTLFSTSPSFAGQTYDPALDGERLHKQLGRVYELMRDGQWRTLSEIQMWAGGSESAISARLRDLRKEQFGGYTIERQRVKDGLWRYRMIFA